MSSSKQNTSSARRTLQAIRDVLAVPDEPEARHGK
jgi:hypothetical protein